MGKYATSQSTWCRDDRRMDGRGPGREFLVPTAFLEEPMIDIP